VAAADGKPEVKVAHLVSALRPERDRLIFAPIVVEVASDPHDSIAREGVFPAAVELQR
jgi:hypothetical protein